MAAAIKFARLGKGDMVNIHVQPHTNGICRDQKIDLAGLIHLNLGIAGARRKPAHHNRRAAALLANNLGNGINIIRRKSGDGAAPWQARQLMRAAPAQPRKPRPRLNIFGAQKLAQNRCHCGGAQQYGLRCAARMQNAVGKNMAAFFISRKLALINGDKFNLAAHRHGLSGANEIARFRRQNFLFTGNQRNIGLMHAAKIAFQATLINLTRQQPQGQANHAALMGQ